MNGLAKLQSKHIEDFATLSCSKLWQECWWGVIWKQYVLPCQRLIIHCSCRLGISHLSARLYMIIAFFQPTLLKDSVSHSKLFSSSCLLSTLRLGTLIHFWVFGLLREKRWQGHFLLLLWSLEITRFTRFCWSIRGQWRRFQGIRVHLMWLHSYWNVSCDCIPTESRVHQAACSTKCFPVWSLQANILNFS